MRNASQASGSLATWLGLFAGFLLVAITAYAHCRRARWEASQLLAADGGEYHHWDHAMFWGQRGQGFGGGFFGSERARAQSWIAPAGAELLRKYSLPDAASLTETQISSLDVKFDADLKTLIPILAKHREITELSLDGTAITDEGLQQLVQLTHLQKLDLRKTAITDAGMAALAQMTNLEVLWLDETRIEGRELHRLAALPRLVELGVSKTPVTLEHLTPLKVLPHLRVYQSFCLIRKKLYKLRDLLDWMRPSQVSSNAFTTRMT